MFKIGKEFIFAFFLLSGTLKGVLGFLPDITIISMAISTLTVVFPVIIKKEIPNYVINPIALYFLIAGFILVSVLYSSSDVFSIEKSFRFLTITAWSFIGALFLLNNEKSLKKFFSAVLVLSYIMAILSIFQYMQSQGSIGFISVAGANYIALGRVCAIGVLILICLYLYDKNISKFKSLITLLSIALFVFALFVSGGRMPVIALVVSLVVFIPLSFRVTRRGTLLISKGLKKLMIVISVVVLFALPFFNKGVFDTFLMRLELLTTRDGGSSVSNRVERMSTAIDMWVANPIFGTGIGSFSMSFNGRDVNDYPHNIFLEFLSETGLVGFTLFIILLVCALKRYYYSGRIGVTRYRMLIFSFFIYMLINVNVAGDINDNRMFFTALGLLCISPLLNKEHTLEDERQEKRRGKVRGATKRYKLV